MTSSMLAEPHSPSTTADGPRVIVSRRSTADRVYRALAQGAGSASLVVMTLIGSFLLLRSLPAFRAAGWSFLSISEWQPDSPGGRFGIASVIVDTVFVSFQAVLLAVPAAIMTALFINEFAPRRVRGFLTAMVDLLAAVPAIIYGLWGRNVLAGHLQGVSKWLNHNLGFVPFFRVDSGTLFIGSRFIAGVVVGIMVLPIATSVMRQVFSQAPPSEREASLALGSTRWGMIKTVILPFGRGGIVGGSMLGLGRALGETVAVALILTSHFGVNAHVLQSGGNTMASLIGSQINEAQSLGRSGLMAAGLVLFTMTLVVNLVAATIVARSRSGSGVEA